MKLTIKQYKYEKVETDSKEIELPTEPMYFFETGIRRSIRIVPVFTTWNKELGKEEEVYELEVTCVYRSFECRIEKFSLSINDIKELYFSEKSHHHKGFVEAFVNNWLDKRTKEQFESDLNSVISSI